MEKWKVDAAHTNVGFTVKHMMVSRVRGNFTDVEGTLEGNPENLEQAKIRFQVGIDSINTNNEDRDNHLRSADFFDVENYPNMTFESTKISKKTDDEYNLTGNLTIKGETRETTFTAEHLGVAVDPWGNKVAGFEAAATISRKQFGLTWNQTLETGGVLVGDDINIQLEIEMNPAE